MSDLGQNIVDIGFDPQKFDASKDHVVAGLNEVLAKAQELPPQFKATFDSIVAQSNAGIKVGSDGGFGELKSQMASLQKETERYRQENEKLSQSLDAIKNKVAGQVGATKQLTAEQAKANLVTAEANKQTKLNAILEESIAGSIGQHRVQIKLLTDEREKLNITTAEGKARLLEINKSLDDHNRFIQSNLDLDGQRIANIGNYNGQLGVLSKALRGIGGLGRIVSEAIGIEPEVFVGITEAGRAVRDLRHIREGEELVKKEETATTVENTVAHNVNTAAMEANVAATKSAITLQKLYTFVVGESTGAMKAFRIVLASTGIGLLLIGLAVLVTSLNKVSAQETEVAKATRERAEEQAKAMRMQETYNEVQKEAIKSSEQEVVSIGALVAAARNENLSREQRQNAITKLQEEYPGYLKNITLEKINSEEAKTAIDELTKSLLAKAVADEYAKRVADAVIKQADIKRELDKQQQAVTNGSADFQERLNKAIKAGDDATVVAMKRYGDPTLDHYKVKIHDTSKELQEQSKVVDELTEGFNDATAASLKFIQDPKKDKKNKKDKTDNLAAEEAKARFEIFRLEAERRADLDMEIVKNEKLSYTERLDALNDYANTKQKIIDETAKYELTNTKLTDEQIQLVEAKRIDSSLRLAHTLSEVLKKTVQDFKTIAPAFTAAVSGMTKSIQKQIDELEKEAKKKAEDGIKALGDAKKKEAELEIKLAEEVANTIQAIGDDKFEREKNRIQQLINANDEYAQAETDRINNSSLSEQEKAAKLIQLKATTDEKNKEFARRQKEEDIKKARFDKAFSIAKIIESTAQSEVEALTYLSNPITAPLYPGIAALIGVIGALQLGVAIGAPIPTYAKGTHDHPGGMARFGEAGAEAVILPGGKGFIADKDTTGFLPKHAKVIPLTSDQVKQALDRAMITGTADRLALIEAIERKGKNNEWLAAAHKIVEAIEKKKRPVVKNNINVGADFHLWVNKYVNGKD